MGAHAPWRAARKSRSIVAIMRHPSSFPDEPVPFAPRALLDAVACALVENCRAQLGGAVMPGRPARDAFLQAYLETLADALMAHAGLACGPERAAALAQQVLASLCAGQADGEAHDPEADREGRHLARADWAAWRTARRPWRGLYVWLAREPVGA